MFDFKITDDDKIVHRVTGNELRHNYRFIPMQNGWWRDKVTGLQWSQWSSSEALTYNQAVDWCDGIGGRTPTLIEFFSIIDYFLSPPMSAINDSVGSYYWTSTEYREDNSCLLAVNLSDAKVNAVNKIDRAHVRAVRGEIA